MTGGWFPQYLLRPFAVGYWCPAMVMMDDDGVQPRTDILPGQSSYRTILLTVFMCGELSSPLETLRKPKRVFGNKHTFPPHGSVGNDTDSIFFRSRKTSLL